MNKSDLPRIAKESLKHLLDRSGEVIYSSHETLKKGDIYLMGLNPGGDPDDDECIKIREHFENILSKTTNSYVDEEWANGKGLSKKGKAPLQLRVQWLIKELGYEITDVCATNLIFQKSKSSDELCFGLAGICWRFHEHVIEIVQPKLILTFGNALKSASPYFFLKSLLGGDEIEPIKAGHGNWECRGFEAKINGRKTIIIGLPHLSYYNPDKPNIIDWIKEHGRVDPKS